MGDGTDKKDDWMKEIIDFLQESILPEDKTKARKIRLKAARYAIIENVLYIKSFYGPLLRCLMRDKAAELLNTIHSGVCGNHLGGRSLSHKAITTRYFWSYMMQDAVKSVKRCNKCQKHASHDPSALRSLSFGSEPLAICTMGVRHHREASIGEMRMGFFATSFTKDGGSAKLRTI